VEPSPEVTHLRDRVAGLERKISDLDARISLLTEKLADAGVSGMSEIVVGEPVEYATPEPYRAPAEPYRAPVEPYRAEPAPEPEPIIEVRTAPSSPVGSADVEQVYKHAQSQREAGQHPAAIVAFNDVLDRFPEHHLADNALYWIAVSHLAQGEQRMAIEAWRSLPLRFPKSPKMPDALFGMAEAHEALGEPVLAETLYAQLVEQYPKAEKVPEARRALARLRPGQ
jgi:tol-pal system protein YbgF